MKSKKIGVVHRLEVEIADDEIEKLLAVQNVPPEIAAFLNNLFEVPAPEKPVCFGVRDQIDQRTKPCSECALLRDCVDTANESVEQPSS